MPRSADNQEPNSTLPHPELNPLINPVLGAHMGRWAEVYFTSPPEKREEAVLDLLRELEAETPTKNETTTAPKPAPAPEQQPVKAHPTRRAEVHKKLQDLASEKDSTAHDAGPSITCRSCGQTNPAQHKFCGMCGADIHQSRSLDSPFLDSPIIDPEEDEVNGWRIEEPSPDTAAGPALVGFSAADRNPFGLSWGSDEGPKLLPDPERVPYRYRIYVGAGLTILLSALGYMAWRGADAGFGGPHSLPPAAPVASPEAAAPQTNVPAKSEPQAADTAMHKATERAAPAPSSGTSTGSTRKAEVAVSSALRDASAPAAQSAKGSGSEELSIAETYLNGTHGKAQDSAEAAKWLWRSVAKQNSRAALVLSDLYLRGSGVAKNCDQARLLLGAAARRGVAGAAERLRNLPAFGCQ